MLSPVFIRQGNESMCGIGQIAAAAVGDGKIPCHVVFEDVGADLVLLSFLYVISRDDDIA